MPGVSVRVRHGRVALLVFVLGLAYSVVFELGALPPVPAAIVGLLTFSAFEFLFLSDKRILLLPRLLVLVYCLPFTRMAGLVFDSEHVWWNTPAAMELIRNTRIQSDMVAVGIIGMLGLSGGIHLALAGVRQYFAPATVPGFRSRQRVLGPATFVSALGTAIAMSWISAPTKTILEAPYASPQAEPLTAGLNFNSAYVISYVILFALLIDAKRTIDNRFIRRCKSWGVVAATVFIAAYLQILRGDREFVTLLVGLAGIEVAWSAQPMALLPLLAKWWRRILVFGAASALLVLALMGLGGARAHLSDPQQRASLNVATALQAGSYGTTWGAVLLTNLGIAGQHVKGPFEYYYGRTYVEYILSLPPGVLTRALGIERAIEGDHGPAWWTAGVSGGGIHLALVPFHNFGVLGVLLALGLFGYLVTRLELANQNGGFLTRLLYAAVVANSIFWAWYGDMYMIRAVMSAAMVGGAYQVLVRARFRKRQTAPRAEPPSPHVRAG